jgi:hypothetical protein
MLRAFFFKVFAVLADFEQELAFAEVWQAEAQLCFFALETAEVLAVLSQDFSHFSPARAAEAKANDAAIESRTSFFIINSSST